MDTGLQPHTINPISINKAAPKKITRCDLEMGLMSASDDSIAKFFLLQQQQDGTALVLGICGRSPREDFRPGIREIVQCSY